MLNMPISDIRLLFEGGLSLAEATQRHILALDEQKHNIEKARVICGMMLDEQSDISALDVDSYLSEINKLESEGVMFVDIRKNDVKKKYAESAAACIVVVAIAVLIFIGMLYLNRTDPAPRGIFWAIVAILAVTVIGTIVSFISRIKEIKGGEENDLGKY